MVSRLFYLRLFFVAFVIGYMPLVIKAQCNVETTVATTDNFCAPGDSIYITLEPSGGIEPYSYIWSTGALTQTISVLLVPSDIYFTITDAVGCSHVNFIHIKAGPYIAGIGGNYFLCGNSSATLNLFWYRFPPDGVTYLWSNGATTPTIDITTGGAYSVTVTDPATGCTATFSTYVDPPSPQLALVNVTPASCGQSNGTIDISVDGEYSPFTYLWSNGATTEDLNNVAAGTYNVTVTASDGCTATLSATVTGSGNLSIPGATTPNNSCISFNGSVDISPSPSGNYTYLWSNGATTQDLSNVNGGNYSVTVTASGGCTATANFSVANNQNVPVASTTTIPATCGLDNGNVDLTVTGGLAPLAYDWSNGTTSQDLTNVPAGTYSVTVTGSNGCTTISTATVGNNNPTINISGNVTPNTSCGGSNGSVNISVSPSGSYGFDWSNGETSEDLTNLSQGNYSVTVTNQEGCEEIATFTVGNNQDIPVLALSSIPASCGQNNGSIDLTPSGSGPFTFNWSNGFDGEDLNNISAGSYSVTVTSGNGCSSTASIVVANSGVNIDINYTTVPNSSCITNNGSIDLTILPSNNYIFLWSNGETTADLFNLAEGNYTVTVTDPSGCFSSETITVGNIITPLDISSIVTPAACDQNNGSINLTVNNGTGPLTFLWSDGSITEDVNNLSEGIYFVTVTDGAGCISTSSITILQEINVPEVTAVTVAAACGQSNGSIDLNVTGGFSPFTFIWSNSSVSEDLSNIQAGNYNVTITDSKGCITTYSTAILNENASIIINGAINPNTSCINNNGSIDLSIVPSGTYTFNWSDGTSTEDRSALSAGAYIVTVTDAGGCSSFASFTIAEQTDVPIVTGEITSGSCANNNGKIDLAITGGSTPYQFDWSNGATTEDLTGVSSGDYIVTITDANGCTASSSFRVEGDSSELLIEGIVTDNTSCEQLNGAIDVTVTPIGAYTFLWSNGSIAEDLSALPGGNYSVTVTGTNGCIATASFTVDNATNSYSLSGITKPNTSCTAPNGSIDLNISPSGSYTFEWSTGATTEDVFFLDKGLYRVTVTNSNSCSTSALFAVTADTIESILTELITPASCGLQNGSIELSLSPSDTAQYFWSTGDTVQNLYNIAGGSYSVTITDINNCTIESSFIVPGSGSSFTITGVTTDNHSCTTPDGSIAIEIFPAGAYSYAWSNGSNELVLDSLVAGTYEVTVTDPFQCVTSESFAIEDLSAMPIVSAAVINETCEAVNGRIFLTTDPPTGNSFLWSTGDTGQNLDNASAGIYTVTVTASGGCESVHEFEITGTEAIDIELDADLSSVEINGVVTSSVTLNMPVEAIKSISWTPVEDMSCQTQLCLEQTFTLEEPIEISVMVEDTNGCKDQETMFLNFETDPKVYIPTVFMPDGSGGNDHFTIFANSNVEEVVVLEIFNRWGDLLFANHGFPPNDPSYGWNGEYHGRLMNPDVFAYRAVVRFTSGEERTYRGDLTLVK